MATLLDPTRQTSSQPGYFSAPLPANSAAAEFYRENGFLVVEDAFSPAEVAALNADAAAICRGDRGPVGGVEIAAANAAETDDEVLSRFLCIHFPHKISPLMREAMCHAGIVDVLTRIIAPDVKCMQSMLFIKSAGKPGQAWHQDEDFIPTRDNSLCGAWIALDDATVENGCLWVIPGSHRPAVLWPQHDHDDRRFDCTQESREFPWKDDQAVSVEVRAGSVVFFNGYLLHRSLPNVKKTGYRRSLVNHYMSAYSLLPWSSTSDGPRVAIADKRDIVMVAGKDPYAYKGTVDTAKAFVRPTGEGGCLPGVQKKPDAKATDGEMGDGMSGGMSGGGMSGGGMSGGMSGGNA